MPTTRQWEIQNSMFRRQYTVFSRLFKGSKHDSSYRGQNYVEMIRGGNKNYFELAGISSYRGFELQGNITVNV